LSCLTGQNTIQAVGGQYQINGSYDTYGVNNGTYVISSVPSSHPIAFLNKGKESLISFSGQGYGSKVGSDGNTYTYVYGDVTLVVSGDFGTISYDCYFHGYMGGQDNFKFSSTCSVPNPTPQPTSTPNATPNATPNPTATPQPTATVVPPTPTATTPPGPTPTPTVDAANTIFVHYP